MKILVSALLSMEDIIMVKQFCSRCKNGIQILRNHTHILIIYTLLCRFTNCKFAVQSNVGLPRLAQLRYSTVHRWGVFNFLFLVFKQTKLQLKTVKQVYTVLHIQFLLLHVCIVIRACARTVKIGVEQLYTVHCIVQWVMSELEFSEPYFIPTCDVSTYSCLKYGGIKYCLNAIFP